MDNTIAWYGWRVMCWGWQLCRLMVALVLLLGSDVAHAQADSEYVTSYYNNVLPRLISDYEVMSTSFSRQSGGTEITDKFSTGAQNFIGVEGDYKWASLSYSLGLDENNSAHNSDLRFATAFGRLHVQANYTSLTNLNYYRLAGLNQRDTVYYGKEHDILLRNVGVRLDYVFNSKFYYPSAVATSGQQLRSQGSFVLSAGLYYQDFDLRHLTDSIRQIFQNGYGASQFQTARADVGLGYSYNWVVAPRWVIYLTELPNCGIQQLSTSENLRTSHDYSLSVTNYVRAGIVYTWRNKFIGAYAYNSTTSSTWAGYTYSSSYTTFQLHFVLVLRDPMKRQERLVE